LEALYFGNFEESLELELENNNILGSENKKSCKLSQDLANNTQKKIIKLLREDYVLNGNNLNYDCFKFYFLSKIVI
jgi:hypothetical protein